MPDVREYLHLDKRYEVGIMLHGLAPAPDGRPLAILRKGEGAPIALSVEEATALRDALTQWLMDVEVAGD